MTGYLKNSKFLKSTLIFTIANIIDKGLPFFILPFLAAAMPPEDFSQVALFTGIISLTNYTIGFSASGFLNIAFFKEDINEFQLIIYNAILVFLGSFLINIAILNIFPHFISHSSGLSEHFLLLSLFSSLGTGLISVLLSIYRSNQLALPFGILQISRSVLDIGLSLFLVLSLNLSAAGRIWGITLANLIIGLVAVFIIYKNNYLKCHFNIKHFKSILYFGLPLFPHAIANWALSMSDRFFINNLVGKNENGQYALGFMLGMAITVVTQSFNQAWAPHLFQVLKKNVLEEKRNVVKITYIYFILILAVAFIFSLATRFILDQFFPKSYSDSAAYILPISISFALDGMYLMVTNYVLYSERTGLLSLATGICALIKIASSYYFISQYGAEGAIYSSLISYFMLFMLTFILAAKLQPMPWNIFKKENNF